MADNLDQYLASSISSRFHGAVTVVLDRKEADAILRGINIGAQTTSSATVQLVDPGERQVILSGTAGDRKKLTLGLAHGGQEKLAESLVGQTKKSHAAVSACNLPTSGYLTRATVLTRRVRE